MRTGDPTPSSQALSPDERLSELHMLVSDARDRFEQITTLLSERRKALATAQDAVKELEINPRESQRKAGHWLTYSDTLREAREDVSQLLSEVVTLDQQYAETKREIEGYEREQSDLCWQIDAETPETQPEYNPLDPPEEKE